MSTEPCISCRRPKATVECEICQEPVCKECLQFLEASSISFLRKVPDVLAHRHYCPACYDTHVAPALEAYNQTMQQARGVFFFFQAQKRSLPILRRAPKQVRVEACEDRDETILRLAFMAAEQGFNAVIEAELTSKKVRNEGWHKTVWQGVGLPAEVDAERLARRG